MHMRVFRSEENALEVESGKGCRAFMDIINVKGSSLLST